MCSSIQPPSTTVLTPRLNALLYVEDRNGRLICNFSNIGSYVLFLLLRLSDGTLVPALDRCPPDPTPVVGLLTDHTIITGLPVWDKPTKFAISTGIYALSLVVIIRYTSIWKRALRVVEVLTGLALLLEVILIDLQAARHTTSHFNISASFNRYVFVAMGTGIGVLWVCAIVLAVATFRTRYRTPAWTVAVRYGMLLAVAGAGSGVHGCSLPRPDRTRPNHPPDASSGSHTIGGSDGGKGLPVLAGARRTGTWVRPTSQAMAVFS